MALNIKFLFFVGFTMLIVILLFLVLVYLFCLFLGFSYSIK